MSHTDANALPSGSVLSSGQGSYRIEKVLGSGGFGITYLTVSEVKVGNVKAEVPFAVKEHFPSAYCRRGTDGSVVPIDGHQEDFKRSAADFEAEARRLQKYGIDCDNIVKVNEVFQANGTVYYVMQYIKGKSLADYVGSRGTLTVTETKTIMAPVFDAVSYLHSCRVNHLDIKPENIMLERSGDTVTPILIDFGLSVHFKKSGGKTSPKGLMGVTDGFAPLEQYAGIQEFNPATDVYALAATFLFCLTGKIPAKASELRLSDVRKALAGKLDEDELEGLCRALGKSFEDRTQSVAKLKTDLGIVSISGGNGTVVIGGGDPDPNPYGWLKWALAAVFVIAVAATIWIATSGGCNRHGDGVKTDSDTTVTVNDDEEAARRAAKERADSLAKAKADSVKHAEAEAAAQQAQQQQQVVSPAPQPAPQQQPQAAPERKPEVTQGTLNLGYATWSGGIRDGKPHGRGRMTFHSAHAVDRHSSVQASPGDYFNATYENGKLISGKLYDSAGNILNTIVP